MRTRIPKPFYTSKESGSGLASVVACGARHVDTIRIAQSPFGGEPFTMYLRNSVDD